MPDLNLININITDTIPPENFATVDKNALIGSVYTKAQDNEWRKEVEATVQSGIKGVLKPNTPYDAVTNPYPTPWVAGNSSLYEKYDVNQSGTFPNTKDSNDENINVTQNELDLNEVQIWVKNGVAQKFLKAMPQASVNIRQWSDLQTSDFPLSAGYQVEHEDSFWKVGDLQTAASTDVPGVSDKWQLIGTTMEQINNYFLEANIINKGSLTQTDVYGINNKSMICSTYKAEKDGYIDGASAYFSGTGFVSIGLMREVAGKCVIDRVIGRFLITSTGVFNFPIKTLIKKDQFLGITTADDTLFIGFRPESGSNFKCYWSDGILQVVQNNFALAFQFEIDENPIDYKIKESINTLNYVTSQQDGIITVGKITGDFNDINSAVQFSIQNGGGHLINIRPGTYDEHVNMFTATNPSKITLKAIAKDTVNIVSHKGDYDYPALHTKINSHFIDLNFISMDDQKPTPEPTNKSYAVHSDYFLFPNIKVEFEGCKFIQKINGQFAYGAGSDQNQLLRFTECYFENETNSDVPVILWHAEDIVADTFNQRLEMINCFVNSKGGKTLELFDPRNFGEGSASVLFIGNTFKSETQSNANQTLVLTSNITTPGSLIGKIKLDSASRGNNITQLNS